MIALPHGAVKQVDLWRSLRSARQDGDYVLAYEIAHRAVELYLSTGDYRHAGIWLRILVALSVECGYYEQAVDDAHRAIQVQSDDYEMALSLIGLGCALSYIDRRRPEALVYFSRAEKILTT